MQIQSPSFMYQNPQVYGYQSYQGQPVQTSQMQGFYGPQGQPDNAMNLLASVLMRVLDFAFNLITQLTGQGQKSGIGFKSAATPETAVPTQSAEANAAESKSLWDVGKDLFNSLTTSLGIDKLFGTVVDGAKSIFGGGFLKTATKIGSAIASIF